MNTYNLTVLAYQFGSVKVEKYLAVFLFLNFIVLIIVYVADLIGHLYQHPAVNYGALFCAGGLNFFVLFYLVVGVLS